MFVFGDFNDHHKDWITYSGGTDRPGEISNDLTLMVNFPTWIPDCVTLTALLFWIYLFLLIPVFALQQLDHVASVSLDFPTNSKQDALFHCWNQVQVGIDVYIPHHKY